MKPDLAEQPEKTTMSDSKRQLSTSVSDLILAISAFYVSYNWIRHGFIKAAFGLAIQGAAASMGVAKFAMENPDGTVIYHSWKFLAFLATVMGIPLIAIEFCFLHDISVLANKITIFVVAVVLVAFFLPKKTREVATQAVSGFAVLSIIILCYLRGNWYGLFGGICCVFAGTVFGGEGQLLGIPNVDSLHYMLVVANILFGYALK